MLPAVLLTDTKHRTSTPTKDIAITEALGNETLDNDELESSRKLLLQSPSQPTNLFPASFPILREFHVLKEHKILLALMSLWETRLLSNLSFLLWILAGYSTSLAVHITLGLPTAHN